MQDSNLRGVTALRVSNPLLSASQPIALKWSGLRGSNPRKRLGRPLPDHSAKPAEMQKPAGFRVAGLSGRSNTPYPLEAYSAGLFRRGQREF